MSGTVLVKDASGVNRRHGASTQAAFLCKWTGPELNVTENNVAVETLVLSRSGPAVLLVIQGALRCQLEVGRVHARDDPARRRTDRRTPGSSTGSRKSCFPGCSTEYLVKGSNPARQTVTAGGRAADPDRLMNGDRHGVRAGQDPDSLKWTRAPSTKSRGPPSRSPSSSDPTEHTLTKGAADRGQIAIPEIDSLIPRVHRRSDEKPLNLDLGLPYDSREGHGRGGQGRHSVYTRSVINWSRSSPRRTRPPHQIPVG